MDDKLKDAPNNPPPVERLKDRQHEVYVLGDAVVMQLKTGLNDGELDGLLAKLARHGIAASYEEGFGELTVYMPRGSTFVTRPANLREIARRSGGGGAQLAPESVIGKKDA